MKYMAMLKKAENVHPEPLQKVQKDLFTVNAVRQGECIPEKKAAPSKRPGPEMDCYDLQITAVIKELDQVGASAMGVPQNARRKALEIEQEITDAALDDDMPRFWAALREWRAIWLKSLH